MPEDTTDSFEIAEKSAMIVDARHSGSSNFIVELLNISNNSRELLVNTQGSFDGRVAAPLYPGKYVFNVNHDGDYVLNPVDIKESDVEEAPIERDGSDYDVIPVQLQGPVRFSMTAETQSNVIVRLKDGRGEDVELIFNEMGPGEFSTTVMQEGFGLFYIETEDEWNISIETL